MMPRSTRTTPNNPASSSISNDTGLWPPEADSAPLTTSRYSAIMDDSVQLYLREIGSVALLTAEEEVRLAEQIEHGRAAAEQLQHDSLLSFQQRIALERANFHGEEARRQLIQANLRLVVSIAKKYINGPLSLMDLVQEGNIGLMRAVEKFDYSRGHRFSTYATWWIRQAITRAIAEQSRLIRLPVHLVDTISQLRRATRQLEQSLGREPTSHELAAALDMSERKVRVLLQAMAQPVSLEQPLGTDGEGSVGELVASDDENTPLTLATQRMLEQDLAEALDKLSDRERSVLQMRYGLADGRRHTLEEVGMAFGITRERTRQIEADALRHLRGQVIGLHLQAYLD